jgi:hypothetical protein
VLEANTAMETMEVKILTTSQEGIHPHGMDGTSSIADNVVVAINSLERW